MTDWTAIAAGVVTGVVAGWVFSFLPGGGELLAGLLAGGVAGVLTRGGAVSGGWNGLIVGAFWGVVALVLTLLFAGYEILTLQLAAAEFSLGLFGFIAVTTVVSALDSAVAGAVGAALS